MEGGDWDEGRWEGGESGVIEVGSVKEERNVEWGRGRDLRVEGNEDGEESGSRILSDGCEMLNG